MQYMYFFIMIWGEETTMVVGLASLSASQKGKFISQLKNNCL